MKNKMKYKMTKKVNKFIIEYIEDVKNCPNNYNWNKYLNRHMKLKYTLLSMFEVGLITLNVYLECRELLDDYFDSLEKEFHFKSIF